MDAALTGLSSQCQSSLPRLLTSDFASCANILGLVQVATGSGSIIEPLTDYISSVCTQDPCTQAQLNNASSIVTAACQSDIESGSLIPTALNTVIEQYGGVRSLLCTQHQGNGSYCVPEVLGAAQNATGTQLTISALTSLASGDQATTFLDAIPTSVYCTDCGDAITTEAIAIVQNVANSSVAGITQAASQKCGATFGDGQLPSGIVTAGATGRASTSTSSTTGAASRGLALGGKTFALIGTISAALLGASMTIA